jgi:hypothetical protein
LSKNPDERPNLNEILMKEWLIGNIEGLDKIRQNPEDETKFKNFSSTNPGSSTYLLEVIQTLEMIKKTEEKDNPIPNIEEEIGRSDEEQKE